MDNKSAQGLLASHSAPFEMPHSSYDPAKGRVDVRYMPVSNQTAEGTYNRMPATETAYPSPAFSSPGMSSLASPGPFKSMEEVKSFQHMQDQDAVMKRRIRVLKFVLRLASLTLALYMIATMSLTFHKFFNTRRTLLTIPDRNNPSSTITRGPWAKQTKTWPTTVLLVTSTLSFIISAWIMASYVRSIKAANTAYEYSSYVGAAIFAAHVGLWIAVAAAYRAGKDGNDLWGWTCDEKALSIQKPFERVINFRRYCNIQTSSWVTSLLQAAVMILYLVVYIWGYRRLKHQRQMGNQFEEAYEHREGRWSRFIPTKRR